MNLAKTFSAFTDSAIDVGVDLYNRFDQKGALQKNKSRARTAAAQAAQDGEKNVQLAVMKAGYRQALQQAQAGASGFDVNSGSFRDVMRGARQATAFDVLQIRDNAARTAQQYRQQAQDYGHRIDTANIGIYLALYKGVNNIIDNTLSGSAGLRNDVKTETLPPTQPKRQEEVKPPTQPDNFETERPQLNAGLGAGVNSGWSVFA